MAWFQDLQRDIRQKHPSGQPTEPTKAPSVGCVGAHKGHSRSTHAGHSAATDAHKLADFYQLVRSAGVDHGVCLDAAQVARWLPGSVRALVCKGHLDHKELSAKAQHLALRMVTARGIVPDGWTDVAICAECGPVFAARGSDASVPECIWCALRKARQWFPRPRMQCGKCSNFTPDGVNAAGGLGSCGAGHDSDWLCFPHSLRACADWKECAHAE